MGITKVIKNIIMNKNTLAVLVAERETEYKAYKKALANGENPIASEDLITYAKFIKNEIIINEL